MLAHAPRSGEICAFYMGYKTALDSLVAPQDPEFEKFWSPTPPRIWHITVPNIAYCVPNMAYWGFQYTILWFLIWHITVRIWHITASIRACICGMYWAFGRTELPHLGIFRFPYGILPALIWHIRCPDTAYSGWWRGPEFFRFGVLRRALIRHIRCRVAHVESVDLS